MIELHTRLMKILILLQSMFKRKKKPFDFNPLELHTRIFCPCGRRFYHMFASDTPVSRNVTIFVQCPWCGTTTEAKYTFDIDFTCLQKKWWDPSWYRPWNKPWKWRVPWTKHCIVNHFDKNEGTTEEEIFRRPCNCGAEALLHQRRVK